MSITPMKEEKKMRVGELAERTGKTVRALRFYEEMDLLRPINRTKGGFRQYDEQALIRIHWIDRLQDLGFSLRETRDFLDSLRELPSGPAAMHILREFYTKKLAETQASLARLNRLEQELNESLTFLESCHGCDPETPRQACACCDEIGHRDFPTPILVAAVQDLPVANPS